MSADVEKMKFKAPAPPPPVTHDDDESKLVRSAKESAAMRRLGKVLEEKKRLNSTINNHSKRLHNLSKSFRRQTLQENNRNLARAVQRGKERLRSVEAQVVNLNREKQELWDELCRLRQVVGKSDVELNTLVEDRVEKRLSEIRQAASQLMELSGTVVNLCLADRLSLTGRSSPGVDLSEVNAIARPSVGTVNAAMMSTVPVADHCGLPGVPPKSGAPGAPPVSGAPDLSLIAEGSFLEPGMLPPLQFMDDSGRRLSAVSEGEEERRSRSRGSTKSRRSGLITRPSLDEPRSRSRSRSSRNGAGGMAENVGANVEKVVVVHVDNEMSGKDETRNETVTMEQPKNFKSVPRKSLSKAFPSISIENADDSQCDISASEILKQRFPGGDKIARTPPRNSRSNPGSKNATPISGSNTPKHNAFVIPLNSPSSAPKVVPTFTPTRKSAESPKILKKSTNETFSFIPLDDNKSKSDKSKAQASRVVKVKKDLKSKKVTKTKPEVEKVEPEVEKAVTEIEPFVEPSRTRTRRRTYSMEKADSIEDPKENDAKPDLNGTFEKEKPDVLPSEVVAMETTDDEAMEAVAKEAESVVAAMAVPQVVEDNLDDSLGVLDSTVLDALDMELTEVIPHSIRLNESDKVDLSADEPKNTELSDELQVPKADKGLKRPRQISPQDQIKRIVPEKQRKRNPSQRGKKVDPESDDQKPISQDSDDVIMKDEQVPKKTVKSRTKTKTKDEKAPKAKESQAKEVEELDSSSSSADESAATFHYFRSKPGKLNFVVGRKDEKGRPLDPVAMMKKSRSKKKVVPNDKKTEENSSENAEEKCPYEWSGQEPESPGIDEFRKQRSGSESDKRGPKTEVEESKEAEKPVFKIPVARSRTKSKKGPTKSETAEESAKPRSRRTTTVVKSYKEPSDEDSPARGRKVVPAEIVPRDDKRRQTKIIRRVSAIHKPDQMDDVINDVDDVSVHVINDTIVTNDVTLGVDVQENSSSFRKETKTYASSRRETQVIRPKHTPDVRRQTEVLTKPDIKQVLPSEEVTLPEPEVMPFDAAEPEPEPQQPEANEVVDEEMTLDLTKLIKSVNREKAARALPPEPVDDEMTLDLTKLLKHIDRDKMIRDAQPHVTSSKPQTTSSMTSREPQPSQTESEAAQKTKSSKIARRKDSSRRSIRGSIDSPETLAPAMATPQTITGGRLPSDVDSPDLHKLADDLMIDDVTSVGRRSRSSQKVRGESSRDSHVLQSRDQNAQPPTTTKKSSRKGKKERESKSESKARRALEDESARARESESARARESESVRARESVDIDHVGSDEEYQTAGENQEPDYEKRLSESPKRRRRGQVKSYKEPSLNVKMRRDGSTPEGGKKIRKKQSRSSGKGAT